MNNALEYIEDYFTGRLSATEKEAFEDRCISDPAFAEEVAFYVSLRDGLKQELRQHKKTEFTELHDQTAAAEPAPSIVVRLRPFIAAAAVCLLLFVVWNTFFKPPSPQALADRYIEKNFTTLGITMGSNSADRLQAGIVAYNARNFREAEKNFQSLQQGTPQHTEAVQYLGILYLATGSYDKALAQFDTLSHMEQLYANPGPFYKAVTLLKRSGKSDKEAARALLQNVVDKGLPGAPEAKEWLKEL
jgi:tetratricopeptide (TPR) repeat protein